MHVRNQWLMAGAGLLIALSACTRLTQVEFSPGLKSTLATLPKESVVLIIDPDGKSVLADSDGTLATPCTLPVMAVKDGKQVAVMDESTCVGFRNGYHVGEIISQTVIRSFSNPEKCKYCYTTEDPTEQICRPTGCGK